MRRLGRERGSATIEAVIVIPAFLLFLGLIVALGRVAVAHQGVEAAAAEAARAASIARTPGEARSNATAGAEHTLTNQNLRCTSTTVTVNTAGFAKPVGTPADVSVTVDCRLNLRDVSIPGVPGSIRIVATVVSPLDTFRGR